MDWGNHCWTTDEKKMTNGNVTDKRDVIPAHTSVGFLYEWYAAKAKLNIMRCTISTTAKLNHRIATVANSDACSVIMLKKCIIGKFYEWNIVQEIYEIPPEMKKKKWNWLMSDHAVIFLNDLINFIHLRYFSE